LEGEAQLADWVRFALAMVRPKGSITFIHRADRLEALLGAMTGKAGDITVFPLWPGNGKPASRVILRARKGVANPTRLLTGLVLHEADGRYTAAADAVLRDGAGLLL
jgi:tRNA1(Val) A37 N6-methylase TrmN6